MAGLGIDFWQIALHIINIVIVFFLLRKFLYRPISRYMENRSKRIADQLDAAEKRQAEAEQLKLQYDESVKSAQGLAAELIEKGKEAADEQARQIVDSAKETASDLLVRSKRDLERLQVRAKDEMRLEIVDMAVQIAAKVLNREIRPEDNQEIIDSFFSGRES